MPPVFGPGVFSVPVKIFADRDLFVFLGEKDLYVEAKLEELEKARMAAETEADKAKEKYDAALKKYELAQTEIKRLSENNQAEINAEEYEYFISNLSTLTSTERKIYELYLEGKKADEISAIFKSVVSKSFIAISILLRFLYVLMDIPICTLKIWQI